MSSNVFKRLSERWLNRPEQAQRKVHNHHIVKEQVQQLVDARNRLAEASSIKSGDAYIEVSDNYSKFFMALNNQNPYMQPLRDLGYAYYLSLTQVIESFSNNSEKKERSLEKAENLTEDLLFTLDKYSKKEDQ
ncbi:hypothetical protein [Marinilactibacillus piezotolerans]|uniref:hypothetical protein n=1 Tax=Marinilactibacillus piezotolerans TaxID=258723 RepID=UPI0009AF6DB6|nr:hypothetical protein [Marinilactibacillus piezotolerans]